MNEGLYYVMFWQHGGWKALGQFSTRLSAMRCARKASQDNGDEPVYVVEIQAEYRSGARLVSE